MNERIILQVVAEQQQEIRQYKPANWVRRAEEKLFEWDSSLAQVVIGVRRSGKSTLCHKVLLERGVHYGYVDFNDDRLIGMKAEDLNTLLSVIYQVYGTDIQYLFLDEVQDVEGWHLFVNRLLRQQMHVFLTGSNARLLSSELSTYLTGRYNEIRLFPFSYLELCQLHEINIHGVTTKEDAERKSLFSMYLSEGGMPELGRLSQRGRMVYVSGLVETILSKDIAQRYNLRNVESLRRIADYLISNTGQEINYDVLMELTGIKGKPTVVRYVTYLSQAFLIFKLRKFSFKTKERITQEKAYTVDTGFIANREQVMTGRDLGWRLETMVYIELKRRYSLALDDIFYYKPTSRSKEVDFVVVRQGKVVELIQVAYTMFDSRTRQREISGLLKASDALRCDNISIVTLDEGELVKSDGKVVRIVNAIEWFCSTMPLAYKEKNKIK